MRPYLVAHERQQQRRELELALSGADIGPWISHGVPIGQVPRLTASSAVVDDTAVEGGRC